MLAEPDWKAEAGAGSDETETPHPKRNETNDMILTSLPGPQAQPALGDRDAEGGAEHAGLDVRLQLAGGRMGAEFGGSGSERAGPVGRRGAHRHVVRPLRGVGPRHARPVALGDDPSEEGLHIHPHIGIAVLVDS